MSKSTLANGKLTMSKKVARKTAQKAVDTSFPYKDMDTLSLLSLELQYDPYHGDDDDDDNNLPDDGLQRWRSPYTSSIKTLCAELQNGCTADTIKWYIQA
jgi:hypothetical protein